MPADHRPTASTITDTQLDALYAERDQLAAEVDGLRSALRSAAVLLASAADRIATGQPVDEATLRHAARAARDVADH